MIDARAFEEALHPLLARSAGYARSLLGSREEAQDAVQQAALHAWERRSQFDASRSFQPWWFGILRHQCLDVLRRHRRAPRQSALEDIDPLIEADESAVDRRALERAFVGLPEIHRDVLRLRYFGDLAYDEIALVLAVPRGTVMSRLHSARKALAGLVADGRSA